MNHHLQAADLQIRLEASQKLVEQRDAEAQTYLEQISQLRHAIEDLRNPVPEVRQFQHDQLDFLEKENSDLLLQIRELQSRYLQVNAQKHSLRAQLNVLGQQPPHGSTGNSSLMRRIAELEAENRTLTSSLKDTETKFETVQHKLDEYHTENKKLRKEAKDTFAVLQEKLIAARNGALEANEAERDTLQTTVDQLEKSSQELLAQHGEFVQHLGRLLDCDDAPEIVARVRELILLPAQIEKLRFDLIEMRNRRLGNVHEGYEAVIDALKQVYENLSPNALKLAENSVLRQLFASFCNLVTALLRPVESKQVLMPHVRAVVFQARVFSPEMSNVKF
jgi:chromosome segregation ATPase